MSCESLFFKFSEIRYRNGIDLYILTFCIKISSQIIDLTIMKGFKNFLQIVLFCFSSAIV